MPVVDGEGKHFQSSGLILWLRELGLEAAFDHFAGAAGAEVHGQHIVNSLRCVIRVIAVGSFDFLILEIL